MAASQALSALAKMDVPDSVSKAYGGESFRFGREYLIPKLFDFRVLLWVAPAVAEAAMASGVARKPITDMPAYLRRLEAMLSRSRELMSVVIEKARRDPKRIVFPEGEHPKILRAAKILAEEGICRPVLLAREKEIENLARDLQLPMDKIEFVHTETSPRLPAYARRLEELRRRSGMTADSAARLVRIRNYFGPLMLEAGEADGVISGLTQSYPDTIRPALQIVGTAPGVRRVSGLYILMLKDRTFFFADTTVNIDPDGRGARRNRAADRGCRASVRHRAAPGAHFLFEFRVEHARERAEGQEGGRADPGVPAGSDCRRRDAGGLRGRPRDAGSRLPLGRGPAAQRVDFSQPRGGQRRLQAGLAAGGRRGDRTDPSRHGPARSRPAARASR